MTVKDVIKLLPVDESMKTEILEKFDTLSPDQQLAISRMAWNYYDTMYGQNLENTLDEQFKKVLDGEEQLGKDYYPRAVKKTEEVMTKTIADTSTQADLTATRKEVQEIVENVKSADNTN